jgi:hypothetical protein
MREPSAVPPSLQVLGTLLLGTCPLPVSRITGSFSQNKPPSSSPGCCPQHSPVTRVPDWRSGLWPAGARRAGGRRLGPSGAKDAGRWGPRDSSGGWRLSRVGSGRRIGRGSGGAGRALTAWRGARRRREARRGDPRRGRHPSPAAIYAAREPPRHPAQRRLPPRRPSDRNSAPRTRSTGGGRRG